MQTNFIMQLINLHKMHAYLSVPQYVFFLILVFLLEAAAAGLGLYGWFYFPTSIRREVQQKQLHNYGVTDPANEHFTNALNYVQYEVSAYVHRNLIQYLLPTC